MKLSLVHPRSGLLEGEIEWDPSAGTLTGDPASRVLALVRLAEADGAVWIDPPPASIPIEDPLRSREQMAAILGLNWRCPELAGDYPTVPDHTPDLPGVVN